VGPLFLALLLQVVGSGAASSSASSSSGAPAPYRIQGKDSIRLKMWNSTGTGQDFQVALKVRFIRQAAPNTIVTVTKIITPGNDRGISASTNVAAFPFGVAAAGVRSVSDANTTSASGVITSATAAFTSADVGKQVTISGAATACSSLTCQGPTFPSTTYQGVITTYTSATQVTVQPNCNVTQNTSSATLKIHPVLLADDDGLELGDGWLVGADINFWQGSTKRGQAFFEMEINRGSTVLGIHTEHEGVTLVRDYLESSNHISWPFGVSSDRGAGPGAVLVPTVSTPAAGANIIATVPNNTKWRIQSFRFALITDATVASRLIAIRIKDASGNVVYDQTFQVAQTASLTYIYTAAPGSALTLSVFNLRQTMPIPINLVLTAGYTIETSTGSLQAGDTFTVPILLVEEWVG